MQFDVQYKTLKLVDFKEEMLEAVGDSGREGRLTIDASVGVQKETKILTAKILVEVFTGPEDTEEASVFVGLISTQSDFTLTNWDEIVKSLEGGRYDVPDELQANLIRIAYDTTRGMLRMKAQGNILQNILLPVFNPIGYVKAKRDEINH